MQCAHQVVEAVLQVVTAAFRWNNIEIKQRAIPPIVFRSQSADLLKPLIERGTGKRRLQCQLNIE